MIPFWESVEGGIHPSTYPVEELLGGRDLLRQLVEAFPLLVYLVLYLSLDPAHPAQFLVLHVPVLDLAGQGHLTLPKHSRKIAHARTG